MRQFRYLDALTTAFVVILLVSNLVAQKIVRVGPFSTSGAIILFPITYIFGDIFTEVYGYTASHRAIWFGFFSTALMYGIGAFVIALPADPAFHNQQAFVTVFGILPRILVTPLTYLVVNFLKRAENSDAYDARTNFNPFRLASN